MKITKRLKPFSYVASFFCLSLLYLAFNNGSKITETESLSLSPMHSALKNIGQIFKINKQENIERSYLKTWMHYKYMDVVETRLTSKLRPQVVTKSMKRKKKKVRKNYRRPSIITKAIEIEVSKLNPPKVVINNISMKMLKVDTQSELNSKELIEHNGFEAEPIAVASSGGWTNYFASQNMEKQLIAMGTESKNILEDSVGVAQAGPIRKSSAPLDPTDVSGFVNDEEQLLQEATALLNQQANATIKKKALNKGEANNDELVLIDYSGNSNMAAAPKSPVVERLDQLRTVSDRVEDVINREMAPEEMSIAAGAGKEPVINLASQTLGYSTKVSNSAAAAFLNTQKKSHKKSLLAMDTQSLMKMAQRKRNFNPNDKVTHTTLNILNANFNHSFGEAARNLSFIPAHDPNRRLEDNAGDGKLIINEKLNGNNSVLRGTIQKLGSVPTKVDIVLEEGKFAVDIPLIEENSLATFLEKERLQGYGAFLLVDLDEQVDSIDVDSESYEAKLFLNSRFKVVSEVEDYQYVFYIGLPSGNTLLRYLTLKDKVAQKVIHLTEGEIYFEGSSFKDEAVESFLLFERNIMGKAKSELDIDEVDILYYNTDLHPKKQALNRYEIRRPTIPLGTRKYFEFKHLGEKIFLGSGSNRKFELPSRGFIQNAMARNKIDSLNGTCMIQLNFAKRMANLTADGETHKGPMSLETTFLDRDGIMNYEASELATNAFLIGDLQGVINIKIEYEDNSVDYLQTYCSPDTYLIEQL